MKQVVKLTDLSRVGQMQKVRFCMNQWTLQVQCDCCLVGPISGIHRRQSSADEESRAKAAWQLQQASRPMYTSLFVPISNRPEGAAYCFTTLS